MNDQKQQIVEKLKAANNILVTVSADPSVDQLAACLGLTLILNRLDKHATAVFSGTVPSTIEFLKPEETIERTTDSLRDFIISLDKSKADKLRYKVEDDVVRIFITPYRTSLSEKDLVFGQGDFNVDVIVGLGVHRQTDLDSAITAHGRILHDATIMCINNTPKAELGAVNWLDLSASSLSELVAELSEELGPNLFDEQNATALLTGIVAETNHFGSNKTRPQTLRISAHLLEAGANQQLVASQLMAARQDELPSSAADSSDLSDSASRDNDGTLAVQHDRQLAPNTDGTASAAVASPDASPDTIDTVLQSLNGLMDQSKGPDGGTMDALLHESPGKEQNDGGQDGDRDKIRTRENQYEPKQPHLTDEEMRAIGIDTTPASEDEPEIGKPVVVSMEPEQSATEGVPADQDGRQEASVASSEEADEQKQSDPEQNAGDGAPASQTIPLPAPQAPAGYTASEAAVSAADGPKPPSQKHEPILNPMPPATPAPEIDTKKTLSEIETELHSPHATSAAPAVDDTAEVAGVDSARKAVEDALKELHGNEHLEPVMALGAQPVDVDLGHHPTPEAAQSPSPEPQEPQSPDSSGPPAILPDESDAPSPFGAALPSPSSQPSWPPMPTHPVAGQFGAHGNEHAPLAESPADQPLTMPLPPTITVPPPRAAPPTSVGLPPQGPPPPPSMPPPIAPL